MDTQFTRHDSVIANRARDVAIPDTCFSYDPCWLSATVIFLLLLVALLLTYASVLLNTYAFMDDYSLLGAWVRVAERGWQRERELAGIFASGRPVYGLLVDWIFPWMQTLGSLRWLRFFGVIGIALLAWMICRALHNAGWGRVPSILAALSVSTMPPFQVYASWAAVSLFPFAGVSAGFAFVAAQRVFVTHEQRRPYALILAALMFLYGALTLYQPAAMYFWVFVAISVLGPTLSFSTVCTRMLWAGGIAAVGMLLGFITYKLGLQWYGASTVVVPGRTALTLDIVGKLGWFLREPLTDGLNAMNLIPSRALSYGVVVFLGVGLFLYFRGTFAQRMAKLLVAGVLVPLSYLPNLVVLENWSSYRTQSALVSLIVLYAFYALWGYCQRLRQSLSSVIFVGVLGCFTCVSMVLAARNVTLGFVIPQQREWQYLREQLKRIDLTQVEKLYVICARRSDFIAPILRYDEFGLSSTAARWVPESAVYFALSEVSPQFARIPVEVVPAKNADTIPASAVVIDMRKLSRLRRFPDV